MIKNKYPTIRSVIWQEDGKWKIIKSTDFFQGQELLPTFLKLFEKRQYIIKELKKGNAPYICSYCKIPVKISGGNTEKNMQSLHFRHAHRNENCIFEEYNKLTREQILCIKYNGAKESYNHEYLKNTVAIIIENSKTPPLKVEVEKIIRNSIVSKEWRKPDIRAEYTDKELVFELQLSSTFVDIIIERAAFYKERKSFLIWIFDEFSTELKNQTFSQTDILVSSNYNVFVFDKEMEILSKQKK